MEMMERCGALLLVGETRPNLLHTIPSLPQPIHVMIVMHSRYTIRLVSIAGMIVNLRTPPTRNGEVRFKVRDEAKACRAASGTRELLAW